jgi:predicted Zn-dependent peptidase
MQLGRIRTQKEVKDLADSITAAEVGAAAGRYLDPAALRCVLVGPAEAQSALAGTGCLPSNRWITV